MEKFSKLMDPVEKGLCYTALALMALLPAAEALLRPLGIVIPHTRFFMIRLFMVSSLLAAMLTTRARDHIAIAVIQYLKNKKIKYFLFCLAGSISTFTATVLFWNSVSFLKYSFSGRALGIFSDRFFALIMPIAFGIIAIRFAAILFNDAAETGEGTKKQFRHYLLPVLVLLLGCIAALPAITKIIWGFDPPEPFFSWVNSLYDMAFFMKTPLILILILVGIAGTPIFVIIGCIAMVMLQAAGSEPDATPIQIYSALTDSDIIAIPLFTLTGFFLSESKAGERLVAAFRGLFGWLPGGTIIATVIICAFFTSFTGGSGVTILALGGILLVILQKGGGTNGEKGYPEKFSVGLLTSAGGIGILFPPSLPIILVATTINSILFFMGETVNYNIIDFFLGAIIPGIILVLAMIIYGMISTRKVKIPVEPFKPKQAARAVKSSILEILLPVILIGGYFSGILTLVEISAVSVFYVFIAEVLIKKDIKLKDVPHVFTKAVPIIGGILAILAMAKALSYAVVDSQVPETFAYWMRDAVESKYLFLLFLNLTLIFIGFFMDIFSAILVVLPLVVPLAQVYGIDAVHLGIIFLVNLEAGYLTPPVGINLFLASYRFKKPFAEICVYVLPFLAVRLVVVLLVTYIPWFSSFLIGILK